MKSEVQVLPGPPSGPLTSVAVAKGMDLQAAPIVKGIFWLRAVPAMLRGQPSRPRSPGAG
jgi:hypothetical protein